ncbi:MAG: phosphatidylserine/phosphatidylglycerophosphate/cardiolipin synthase family protein [Cyanophyceae cyanobacterium]
MSIFAILQWLFWLVLGLACLILIGLYIRGAFRQSVKYRVKNSPSPGEPRFPLTLASLSSSFYTSGAITHFWSEVDDIQQARLQAIQSAQRTIHFETFFMTPGRRANDFAAAIAERAAAGVEVRLVVDSYGTRKLGDRYWQRLKAAGVHIAFFNQFNWRAPANYAGRTHRKLLLTDSQFALIGGAGVSDLWDGVEQAHDTQPWFDIEVRLEGEIVAVLEGLFMQHLTYSGGVADLAEALIKPDPAENPLILITPGTNPTYRFSPIKALKLNCIAAARKRIWISSPYFLPDLNSRKLLLEAKRAGIDVRILTTSIRTDKKFVYYASAELYGELLKGGVEIYEYQPSMIHAKMLLVDDCWVNTGSANFDPRSFFHNDELDISAANPFLINSLEQAFEKGFSQSKRASLQTWQQRPAWQRSLGQVVRFFQWQL